MNKLTKEVKTMQECTKAELDHLFQCDTDLPVEHVYKSNPIMTRLCDHPRCTEVIYRDTLDKDQGYQIADLPARYFCSVKCGNQILDNKLYFNMANKQVKFK